MKVSEHIVQTNKTIAREINTIQKHTEKRDHELSVVVTRSESSSQPLKSRDNLYGNMLYVMHYIPFIITNVYVSIMINN